MYQQFWLREKKQSYTVTTHACPNQAPNSLLTGEERKVNLVSIFQNCYASKPSSL